MGPETVREREPLVPKGTAEFSGVAEPLYKVETLEDYCRATFSSERLIVIIVILVLSFVGFATLPQTMFTYVAGDHLAVLTRTACQYQCESTHVDPVARRHFGGTGLCTDTEGNGLAKFEVCDPKRPDRCVAAPSRAAVAKVQGWRNTGLTRCSFRVVAPEWVPYFVFGVVAFAAFLIAERMPPDICLLCACCVLAGAGIITPEEAFRGIANTAVVAIAFLFPIAAAIEDTGILHKLVMPLLGAPEFLVMAIPRMAIVVMLLSGFMSNTGIVAMMIPLLSNWARRLKCHPGKLMMNLSYAGQLGGSITLIGSSCTLVAAQSVREAYVMHMFDTFFFGTTVGLITIVACALLTPTSLLQSSDRHEDDTEAPRHRTGPTPGMYEAYFVVVAESAFVGMDRQLVQEDLACIPGVISVAMEGAAEDGAMRAVASNEVLIACANAQGVVGLRRVEGLKPMNEAALTLLGGNRRSRRLYEGSVGVLSDGSSAIETLEPEILRYQFCMALVASRGPDGHAPWNARDGGCVKEGDVLLFEANHCDVLRLKRIYTERFSLLHQVPLSEPPRRGLWFDQVRTFAILGFFTIFLVLVSLDRVPLHWGAGLVVALFVAVQALTPEQLYRSINGNVLLVVGSAFGVARAVEKAGLANLVALQAMKLGGPFGMYGMAIAVYIVAMLLGLVVNSAAICAMVGPMLLEMTDKDPSLDLKALTWVLICSAGASLISPLGYQTNIMVMPAGEYSFLDFVRFGLPVQLVHCVATVSLAPLFARLFD